MAQFLSEDHMAIGTAGLNDDAGFTAAMNNVELGLQFNVTDAPDGEIDYYLTVGDGVAVLALGTLEDADASVSSDYETAAAISPFRSRARPSSRCRRIIRSGGV